VRVVAARALILPDAPVTDVESETARVAAAAIEVAEELRAVAGGLDDADAREILEAQALMAQDPVLVEDACQAVRDHHSAGARAIVDAGEGYARQLAASGDEYMAARAADIRDVCRRIAERLVAAPVRSISLAPGDAIVVARDIAPADAVTLDWSAIRGIATEEGGRTSHMSILARNFGVPAIVAVAGLLDTVQEGANVALDGDDGSLYVDPDDATREALEQRAAARRARVADLRHLRDLPAETADGHAVELAGNAGSAAELDAALLAGADGIGLLRTELLYLDRDVAPGEDEQAELLCAFCAALGSRRLIVRVFDIGADKPARFLPLEAEPNPALGIRGIRVLQRRPELLESQLRAVVRAAGQGGRLAVMAPMVATLEEAAWFDAKLSEAGVREAGVEAGVMIEVPSAVLLAGELAEQFDFLSIGTNDLSQYLHGADRESGALEPLQDPFSPALLRAVRAVCAAADGRAWVGACGEAAGNPVWAGLAVGLGVSELSMGSSSLDEVRAALRERTLAGWGALAERAAAAPTRAAALLEASG
jgi:phosphotransferase system enzyme I (PtsI)